MSVISYRWIFFIIGGCLFSSAGLSVVFQPYPKGQTSFSVVEERNILDQLRQINPQLAFFTEEIKMSLDASVLAENGDSIAAEKKFLNAFRMASPYGKEKINLLYKKYFAHKVLSTDDFAVNNNYKLPDSAIPTDKIILQQAHLLCANEELKKNKKWNLWHESLPNLVKDYLKSLVYHCQSKIPEAYQTLTHIVPLLAEDKNLLYFALAASEKLIEIMRFNSMRYEASIQYEELVKLWQKPYMTETSLEISRQEFYRKKIETLFWAARYKALVEEYEQALKYTEMADFFINEAEVKHAFKKADINDFRADSSYIKAFRIFISQGYYAQTFSFLKKNVILQNYSQKWQERFIWLMGLTAYLEKDYQESIRIWQNLLIFSDMRMQAHFWLAKAHLELGNKDVAQRFILTNRAKEPLHYYSLSIDPEAFLYNKFGDRRALLGKLNEKTQDGFSYLAKNKKFYFLLEKTKNLLAANLFDWAKYSCLDLYDVVKKSMPLNAKTIPSYIQLSRLLYATGNTYQSNILTEKIKKKISNFWVHYPEQLFVFYPTPYANIYSEATQKNQIDASMLYAITRQESRFKSDAQSAASAFGLMQLVPSTAKEMAKLIGTDSFVFPDHLKKPEINVQLGGELVKKISQEFSERKEYIFAAYNAGSYPVQKWIKKHPTTDPHLWIEMIPFAETREYVKAVYANYHVYSYLISTQMTSANSH